MHAGRLIRIRPATASDLDALAELVNAAYRGDTARRGWTHEADLLGGPRTDRATLARDRDAGTVILVGWPAAGADDERPLACVALAPDPAPGARHLGMLTVHPDHQRHGLGALLLDAAERHAAGPLGADRLRMTVIALRGPLIAWYERRGWRPTGERLPFTHDDRPRPDLEFIVLEKSLPA